MTPDEQKYIEETTKKREDFYKSYQQAKALVSHRSSGADVQKETKPRDETIKIVYSISSEDLSHQKPSQSSQRASFKQTNMDGESRPAMKPDRQLSNSKKTKLNVCSADLRQMQSDEHINAEQTQVIGRQIKLENDLVHIWKQDEEFARNLIKQRDELFLRRYRAKMIKKAKEL